MNDPPTATGRLTPAPAAPPGTPGRRAASTWLLGCGAGLLMVLVGFAAFSYGTQYTLKLLTNPYIEGSALVQGFFSRLAEGRHNAQRQRYIAASMQVYGLQFEAAEGWWLLGKPAKLRGSVRNNGAEIVETVTLALYFVEPGGKVMAGGDVFLTTLMKPGESLPFELVAGRAGFDFPSDDQNYQLIYQIKDIRFYQPPEK